MDQLNFYLAAANAYATQATAVFNMFLTVLFGSLGFAAALPLRDIGHQVPLFKSDFSVSTSSMLIGAALLSFYFISFVAFHRLSEKANTLISVMAEQARHEKIFGDAVSAFSNTTTEVAGLLPLPLPSFGFVIGSALGMFAFMWLANVEREDQKP